MICRTLKKCLFRNRAIHRIWDCCVPQIPVGKAYCGTKVFMDLRDNIDDLTKPDLDDRESNLMRVLSEIDGLAWDVGANVGLFAVRAALLGKACVAFEQSCKACRLMAMTKRKSNLDFQIVNKAFTVDPLAYTPSVSCKTSNALAVELSGAELSVTYLDSAKTYGTPRLLKMDIEGGEEAFFKSTDFKQWVVENEVAWLVELHPYYLGYVPEWEDVPHISIGNSNHVLYLANEPQLSRISENLQEDPRQH